MPITDTLETAKTYEGAGFTKEQAETMAALNEKHAALTFDEVGKKVEASFDKIARDQTWRFIGAVLAIAALCLGAAVAIFK